MLLVPLDRKTIAESIDGVLGPIGFARHGLTWTRRAAAVTDVVTVQISKAGQRFTLNLGVLDPDALALCWGEQPSRLADEALCTVRARLGQLMSGKDVWWDGSDLTTLSTIASALRDVGLPFLERHHSTTQLEATLQALLESEQSYPPPIIYLAALKARRGDGLAACQLLQILRDRSTGAWAPRIESALQRLGCAELSSGGRTERAEQALDRAT